MILNSPAAADKSSFPGEDDVLTFSLSFDHESLKANRSVGKPDPIEIKGEFSFVPGISGEALVLKDGAQITYDRQGNLAIPGAISFWLQPLRNRSVGKPPQLYETTYFWWTRYKQSGYLGVQDSVYGKLNLWLHYFPHMTQWNISGPFSWEKDRWFHILINLDGQRAELFLDGRRIGQATLERPLKSEELGPFILGNSHNQFAIDELRIFSRPLMPSEIQRLAMGAQPLEGRIAYLPSLGSLVVEAVIASEAIPGASLQVLVTDIAEKQVLLEHALGRDKWQPTPAGTLRLREIVPLPALKEATYRTWIQESPAGTMGAGRFLQREFVVKHYEWENNDLGKSSAVIPPFTPLEVSGNTVKSILRTHYLGNLGLWQQVKSLDRDILDRPVSLHAVSAGKLLSWNNQPVKITEVRPDRVQVEAMSVNELMEVKSVGAFDYDGLMQVTLTITPHGSPSLDHIWLEIPVKEEIAMLFHAVGEYIRANPAGGIPPGQGVVWDSRKLPQPNIENFIPYVWVGGEERGICWAADWDKDWVHSKDRSAIELIRENHAVVIRANLINGPISLNRPRTITFALQASPVKPMPQGWRNLVFDFGYPGRNRFPLLWPPSWGGHYGWASRYPLDQDFSIVRQLADTQRTGTIDTAFVNAWVDRVMAHPGPLAFRDSVKYVRDHVNFAFESAKSLYLRDPPGKLLYYSVAEDSTSSLPENVTFNDEWQESKRMHSSASLRDYAVWYADKMMEAGMGGLYVDNAFLAAKFNWSIGEGYIGEDGEVHPSLGIWRLRELIRRLAVMMHEKGREPLIKVHMTNANMLPVLSFAQAILGWEWKYGSLDFQERFTPDYVRAVNIGRQTGTIPLVLDGITGVKQDSDEFVRLTRTALALALPHEIYFYGGGRMHGPTAVEAMKIISSFRSRPGVEAYPYWTNQGLLKARDNLLVTIYRHQQSLLLVVGNKGNRDDYTLQVDPKRLKLRGILRAVNLESGENIPVTGNSVILNIKQHDFALIELTFG